MSECDRCRATALLHAHGECDLCGACLQKTVGEEGESKVKCSHKSCHYAVSYDSPDALCTWHWSLWFSFGEVDRALVDFQFNRSIHWNHVDFMHDERMEEDASMRHLVDMGGTSL